MISNLSEYTERSLVFRVCIDPHRRSVYCEPEANQIQGVKQKSLPKASFFDLEGPIFKKAISQHFHLD